MHGEKMLWQWDSRACARHSCAVSRQMPFIAQAISASTAHCHNRRSCYISKCHVRPAGCASLCEGVGRAVLLNELVILLVRGRADQGLFGAGVGVWDGLLGLLSTPQRLPHPPGWLLQPPPPLHSSHSHLTPPLQPPSR